jgi:hypothetical protein
MKTPEEIKDSLKVCMAKLLIPKYLDCKCCPFTKTELCDGKRHAQALAYIERLEAERDAAVEELEGVLGKVENAEDFIDEEIYCELDYGTYRNLRDVVDDIAIWENEDKWRDAKMSGGASDGNADK